MSLPERHGKQILCVDDDPGILGALERVLRLTPHQVHTTTDPADALTMVLEIQPDLMLIDMRMPGMSGEELAHRIQQAGSTATIVFITGLNELTPKARALCRGYHIPKPFTNRYVRGVVELLLKEIPEEQRREMLSDLAEREGVSIHHETRDRCAYAC